MTAMPTIPVVDQEFAKDLYRRLPRRMSYVAANWETELLQPLGYRRCDQSDVAHALLLLVQWGLAEKASDRRVSGYHMSRRRDYPRPRRVIIVKVPKHIAWRRRLVARLRGIIRRTIPYRLRRLAIG